MLGKLGGAEAPGLVAPDAAKKDEPRGLPGDAGLKVGQETTGSSPDSGGYGDGLQTPPVDTDLPAFGALRTAAARDGWVENYLADAACTCRVAGLCSTCNGWAQLDARLLQRSQAAATPQPPLSLPKAAGAVLRFPLNAARLRSLPRAAWALDYELEEARR